MDEKRLWRHLDGAMRQLSLTQVSLTGLLPSREDQIRSGPLQHRSAALRVAVEQFGLGAHPSR